MQVYRKVFDRKNSKFKMKLNEGDKVFVRKELRKNKMDDEFSMRGEIILNEYGYIYRIRCDDGSEIRKHVSQLRRVEEGEVGIETCSNVCKKPLLCSDNGLMNDDQIIHQ
jgi:translation initiation factor IF-1